VSDVPADGLQFTFFDAAGTPLGGSPELDDAQRARIRRVVASVTVEIRTPDPAHTQPLRASQTAVVVLRNGA
jgi:hypothetical protein